MDYNVHTLSKCRYLLSRDRTKEPFIFIWARVDQCDGSGGGGVRK